MNAQTPPPARLWWLPLAAGVLPAVGAVVAFRLAVAEGQFAPCMPLLDGCVSVSRAARHGLSNIVFRALLLPAAALQAMVWLLAAPWLLRLGAARDRTLALLPWLGVTAAVFLVLYGSFLGTEGEGYRWMRRYGVVVYFGFTCIAMLVVAGAVQRVAAARGPLRLARALLPALVAALPLLGLVNVASPLFLTGAAAQDALGNVTEWWGALAFTVFFMLLAWLWRATRFSARLESGAR
jgi:hypothetical protein